MSASEKYISESLLKNSPKRALGFWIKNGAVTTDKIADKAVTQEKISDELLKLILDRYPTIKIGELDSMCADKATAVAQVQNARESRFIVLNNRNKLIVGYLDVLSDSMGHVLTQVLTTHFNFENGVLDETAHKDSVISQYYRSYSISSSGITVGEWTEWKPLDNGLYEALNFYMDKATYLNSETDQILYSKLPDDVKQLTVKVTELDTIGGSGTSSTVLKDKRHDTYVVTRANGTGKVGILQVFGDHSAATLIQVLTSGYALEDGVLAESTNYGKITQYYRIYNISYNNEGFEPAVGEWSKWKPLDNELYETLNLYMDKVTYVNSSTDEILYSKLPDDVKQQTVKISELDSLLTNSTYITLLKDKKHLTYAVTDSRGLMKIGVLDMFTNNGYTCAQVLTSFFQLENGKIGENIGQSFTTPTQLYRIYNYSWEDEEIIKGTWTDWKYLTLTGDDVEDIISSNLNSILERFATLQGNHFQGNQLIDGNVIVTDGTSAGKRTALTPGVISNITDANHIYDLTLPAKSGTFALLSDIESSDNFLDKATYLDPDSEYYLNSEYFQKDVTESVLMFAGFVEVSNVINNSTTAIGGVYFNITTNQFIAKDTGMTLTYYSNWSGSDSYRDGTDIYQNKIFCDTSTNKLYRFDGSTLVEVSPTAGVDLSNYARTDKTNTFTNSQIIEGGVLAIKGTTTFPAIAYTSEGIGYSADESSNYSIAYPKKSGTIALLEDIPSISGETLTTLQKNKLLAISDKVFPPYGALSTAGVVSEVASTTKDDESIDITAIKKVIVGSVDKTGTTSYSTQDINTTINIPVATVEKAGLLSKTDKAKLDSLSEDSGSSDYILVTLAKIDDTNYTASITADEVETAMSLGKRVVYRYTETGNYTATNHYYYINTLTRDKNTVVNTVVVTFGSLDGTEAFTHTYNESGDSVVKN